MRGKKVSGKTWFLDKEGSQLTITSKFNIQLLFLMVIGSAEWDPHENDVYVHK